MSSDTHVLHDRDAQRDARALDAAIADVARGQYGVIARAQLTNLGLGRGAIEHRVGSGRLHRLHRGVYAVGHRALRQEASWVAAVLAAGPEAALSHRSAAAFWGIRSNTRRRIDVSVPCRRRSTDRLQLHCVEMRHDEVQDENGIRVTTPARTLFDLAAVVTPAQLEAAFDEAEYRRLTSVVSLDALLTRYPGHRGNTAIRRVLEQHKRYGETRTRSDLERMLLTLLDAHALPRPRINRDGPEGELDARWPEHRLVVECDGFAAHGTRKAFEADRARDRALVVDGWRVVRLTWRQLTTDADSIATQLATLLAQTAAVRSPSAAAAAARPVRTAPSM